MGPAPQGVVLRRATVADAAAVVALVERAYRGETSRAGWTTEADLLDGQRTDADEVTSLLTALGSVLLLAERAAVLLGSVHLRRADDTGMLGMFAVEPTLQGQGLGGWLLDRAERHMQHEMGVSRGSMLVLVQRTELLAWYARKGWRRTHEHRPFPYGEPRFGLPRRADLQFVVLEKTFAPASTRPATSVDVGARRT